MQFIQHKKTGILISEFLFVFEFVNLWFIIPLYYLVKPNFFLTSGVMSFDLGELYKIV